MSFVVAESYFTPQSPAQSLKHSFNSEQGDDGPQHKKVKHATEEIDKEDAELLNVDEAQ